MIVVNDGNVRIERLELGSWGTNAYVVVCLQTGVSVLVDAPAEAAKILKSLEGTKPAYILITHSHSDHTGALPELRARLKVPVGIHSADAGSLSHSPEMLLNDGDSLSAGKLGIQVIHTPGHTPGSLCFRLGKYLLSGDTIFPGGPGQTGSPGALGEIVKSITGRIFALPDDTPVYPGHGDSTTLKKEKAEFAVFSSRPRRPDLCGDVAWLSS